MPIITLIVLSAYVIPFGIINKNSIHTIGYEAKVSILNSNNPILFLSYGEAQTINRWIKNKKPYRYIHMSLINPF